MVLDELEYLDILTEDQFNNVLLYLIALFRLDIRADKEYINFIIEELNLYDLNLIYKNDTVTIEVLKSNRITQTYKQAYFQSLRIDLNILDKGPNINVIRVYDIIDNVITASYRYKITNDINLLKDDKFRKTIVDIILLAISK